MCDLTTNWSSSSVIVRNGVPASGVVFNTTSKGDDRKAGNKGQKKTVNVKLSNVGIVGIAAVIILLEIVQSLLRRKVIRNEKLMLRLEIMMMTIMMEFSYLFRKSLSRIFSE